MGLVFVRHPRTGAAFSAGIAPVFDSLLHELTRAATAFLDGSAAAASHPRFVRVGAVEELMAEWLLAVRLLQAALELDLDWTFAESLGAGFHQLHPGMPLRCDFPRTSESSAVDPKLGTDHPNLLSPSGPAAAPLLRSRLLSPRFALVRMILQSYVQPGSTLYSSVALWLVVAVVHDAADAWPVELFLIPVPAPCCFGFISPWCFASLAKGYRLPGEAVRCEFLTLLLEQGEDGRAEQLLRLMKHGRGLIAGVMVAVARHRLGTVFFPTARGGIGHLSSQADCWWLCGHRCLCTNSPLGHTGLFLLQLKRSNPRTYQAFVALVPPAQWTWSVFVPPRPAGFSVLPSPHRLTQRRLLPCPSHPG